MLRGRAPVAGLIFPRSSLQPAAVPRHVGPWPLAVPAVSCSVHWQTPVPPGPSNPKQRRICLVKTSGL